MAQLGTLWFGADVDLTELKKKIQTGNTDLLNALKMEYDPASYQQMVSKLRTQLSSEVFRINIEANGQSVQNVLQNIRSVGAAPIAPFNTQNLQSAEAATGGIYRKILDLNGAIIAQKDNIRDASNNVINLRNRWREYIQQTGRRSDQSMAAYREFDEARKQLRLEQNTLFNLQQTRARANLVLQEQNVAYKEANQALKAAKIHLADETKARVESATALQGVRKAHNDAKISLEGEKKTTTELRTELQKSKNARLEDKLAAEQQTNALANLKNALTGLVAIEGIRQLLGNVIEIGGQLEKQRVSMGSILGDVAKANVLFERIKELAVKSPFGVVELDQYTKQLAAYGFEYEDQFDMIKRLADIASGAGQDISRLTLALGHVKSQTYLTGYTLRQFAMNNIPMLKMLSEYYTELEGTMVSTAEVQRRISERKVSYEDVIEQIKRLTDEGGIFYNMQEKIATTLAAKWKNLRDQLSIMYGEMAESGLGSVLKTTAEQLTTLARHWETIVAIMTPATAALVGYKIALIAVEAWAKRATIAQTALNLAMKLNPIGLITAGLAGAATYIAMTYEKMKDAEGAAQDFREEMEKSTAKINDERLAAERLASSLTNSGKSMKVRNAAYDKLIEMYPGLLDDMDKENVLLMEKADLLDRINKASKQKEIDEARSAYEKAKKERQRTEEEYEQNGKLVGMGAYARAIHVTEQEVINANAREEEAKKYLDTLLNVKEVEEEIANSTWNKRSKEIAKNFDELMPDDGKSLFEYIDKVGKRLNELTTKIDNFKPGTEIAQDVLPALEQEKKAAETIYYDILGQNRNLKASGGTSKDSLLDAAKTRLEEVKAFLAEYKKYKDVYGKDKAISLLDGLFPDKKTDARRIIENYKEVLEEIKRSLPLDTNDRIKFGISVDKLITETDLDEAKDIVESALHRLDEEIKKQGKQWDLYKKILDATGSKEQAARMSFGGSISFDNFAEQLRAGIEESLKEMPMASTFSVDELLGMDDIQLGKIGIVEKGLDGVYKKLQQLKEEEQNLSAEQVELWIEALKGARSLETDLAKIELKYDKIRESIMANGGDEGLIGNANRNEQIEKADARWEWFKKNTEGWGEMFSNLDYMTSDAIDSMIEKLETLLPNISASEESVKALYEALEKLRNEQVERNPFKTLKTSFEEMSSDDPKTRRRGYSNFEKGLKGIESKFKSLQDVLQPVIDLFDTLGNESLSNFFQMGSNALGSAAGVAGGINSLRDLFGEKSGIGKALGAAGPWGAAAGAALSLASSVAAMHDASLQKEIEASEARQKEMENLSKNLETVLDRAINGILGTKADENTLSKLAYYSEKYAAANSSNPKTYKQWADKINFSYISRETNSAVKEALKSKSYYDSVYASMLAQRDELARQLELEKDKKKSDKGKIADYEQAMTEINDQIKYFATDMMKDLYDIDFKSWAQDLSEAIVSAWESGEDAAEAYRNKVSEILRDLGVKMIAERFMADKLNPIMEQFIRQYEQDKGVLTQDGMRILAGLYDAGDELSRQTSDFLDGINEIAKERGVDLKESSSASSGLSKSIEGVSENTADLLASYLNATRADVSLIAMNIPVQNAIAQTQVQHLESIARHTEAIERHTATMETYLANQDSIHRYVKGIADGTYKVRV